MTQRKYITEYSAEKVREVFAALDSGKNSNVVSKITGVPGRTVRALSQARKEGKLITRRGEHERPVIETDAVFSLSAMDLWRQYEDHNRESLAKARARHKFSVSFKENMPIAISFISDQHITKGQTDMAKMMSDAEKIRDTDGLFCILVGDAIDNHIRHAAAGMSAVSNPREQYRLLDLYLSILQDKIITLISGNHDDWTPSATGGVDVLEMLANNRRIMYAPDEARITLNVNKNTYKIAARHQTKSNSQINPTHGIKRWWAEGSEPFDVGVAAHTHEPCFEKTTRHSRPIFACKPGSYQRETQYSRQKGFTPVECGTCPTFIFYPDKWDIVGQPELDHGIEKINDARAKYRKPVKASSRLSARAATKSNVRRIQAAQRVGKSRRGAK